jgi:dATP pyrophosphohydrolase
MQNAELQFLIGKRADGEYWQAISGGGEHAESPLEAAQRELHEEAGLEGKNWVQLESMCTLPKIYYRDHESWADVKHVIPEYAFMAQCSGIEIISHEHTELRWVSADEAHLLLRYDSNRNALWEACQRIVL